MPAPVRPDDFALRYAWRAGSLPPPHHYRVGAVIEANGSGTASMTPGYPGAETPTWPLPFHLDAEVFDALYTGLRLEGLFADDWQAPRTRRIGGSTWSVAATAEGREVEVRSSDVAPDGASPAAIREAIWGAVPAGVRAELSARRSAFTRDR